MHSLICCLDKEFPPSHSFVDGMLVDTLSKESNIDTKLITSKPGDIFTKGVLRYNGVLCLAVLWKRRNLGRYLNFFNLIACLKRAVKAKGKEKQSTILFVRNDPILLLAAACMKHKVDRLIFQSSFPHEKYSGHIVKRSVAKLLFSFSRNKVDAITAVSPLGMARTSKLFPKARHRLVIPLLSDINKFFPSANDDIGENLGFIFVGTFFSGSEIEVLIRGIVKAATQGVSCNFIFIGGTNNEHVRLEKIPGVLDLKKKGQLSFVEKIPRKEVFEYYKKADVGFSLYFKTEKDAERSPTKLTEYMGAGLAVIASKGIPLQEEYVKKSGAGVLIDLTENEVAKTISLMDANRNKVKNYKTNAKKYANKHLDYSQYLDGFKQTLMGISNNHN